jgi:hypothetical protein
MPAYPRCKSWHNRAGRSRRSIRFRGVSRKDINEGACNGVNRRMGSAESVTLVRGRKYPLLSGPGQTVPWRLGVERRRLVCRNTHAQPLTLHPARARAGPQDVTW